MKPIINHDLCIGEGICEDICSEVFELAQDGLAYVISNEPGEGLWGKVEEACRDCPTDAITLEGYGSEEEMAA